jgi:tetratricopeptide (TPR) repeat protein
VSTLAFGSIEEALAWCEEERGNLIAATRLAAGSGLHEIAWKLPAAAMSFYYRRSHWSDWEMSHQIGLASARAIADRMAEGWILNNLGMAYGVQRREESLQCLHSARALFREVSDTYGEGRATVNLAGTYFRLGLYEQARTEARAYLQQPSQRPISASIARNVLGCASRELGDVAEATEQLQRALSSFRELGEESNQAACLNDLGMVYLDIGDLRSARTCLEEAVAMKKAIGDQEGHAGALSYLAKVEHRAGNTEKARAILVQSLRVAEQIEDHGLTTEIQDDLAALNEGYWPPGGTAEKAGGHASRDLRR